MSADLTNVHKTAEDRNVASSPVPSENLTEQSVFEVNTNLCTNIPTQTRHAHCDIQDSDATQCQGGDVNLRRGSEEEETPRA